MNFIQCDPSKKKVAKAKKPPKKSSKQASIQTSKKHNTALSKVSHQNKPKEKQMIPVTKKRLPESFEDDILMGYELGTQSRNPSLYAKESDQHDQG